MVTGGGERGSTAAAQPRRWRQCRGQGRGRRRSGGGGLGDGNGNGTPSDGRGSSSGGGGGGVMGAAGTEGVEGVAGGKAVVARVNGAAGRLAVQKIHPIIVSPASLTESVSSNQMPPSS